eukprot:TRINITY_DN5244_c0_g1_i3.p1 TRINITY_DN5244_c0_g1~~TRINITY_DN5244_c0_g1_i3.p1  ORF type:complete len:296 (+),score=36.11 TRINITY_DN5244_c0_g1_i3:165-1052(+)
MESLDFQVIDNVLLRSYTTSVKWRERLWKSLGKWLIAFLIGVIMGLIVYCVKMSVENLTEIKFEVLNHFVKSGQTFSVFFLYLAINLGLALLGCLIVFAAGPVTSSSGIPEVKGYLNGVRVLRAFNARTLIGKITSLILAFSSNLALGPEGPMFHIGSMVGAALSQAKSKTIGFNLKSFWRYQNDRDKRDFISCGAAAGIAAAFGAPIGGVLFAMEEGSSFWSKQLSWRTFFQLHGVHVHGQPVPAGVPAADPRLWRAHVRAGTAVPLHLHRAAALRCHGGGGRPYRRSLLTLQH